MYLRSYDCFVAAMMRKHRLNPWSKSSPGSMPSIRLAVVITACACAASTAVLAVRGVSLESVQLVGIACLLAYASFADVRERIIPNWCVASAALVRGAYLAYSIAVGACSIGTLGYFAICGLGVGAALIAFALLFERVTSRESMGGGDVKLYALSGWCFGAAGAALVIAFSCIASLLAAVVSLGARRLRPSKRAGCADPAASEGEEELEQPHEPRGFLDRTLPFGPSISIAFAIVMLIGF